MCSSDLAEPVACDLSLPAAHFVEALGRPVVPDFLNPDRTRLLMFGDRERAMADPRYFVVHSDQYLKLYPELFFQVVYQSPAHQYRVLHATGSRTPRETPTAPHPVTP